MSTMKHISRSLLYAGVTAAVAPIAAQAETTIDVYGYTKLDLIYDLDANLGDTTGGLGSLEPGFDSDTSSRAHARQTRLGVRVDSDTAWGDLKAVIEGDFFGGAANPFRLRQGYGEINGILAGQTWTNFMPIESYPGTVDFQGPAGIPFARVAQLRYTYDTGSGFKLSGSIEDDVSASSETGVVGESDHLAVTAAASYAFNGGFVKLAGIGRQLNGDTGDVDGFGINLSGNVQPWQGGSIQASYTTGEGIGSLLVFGGTDVDGDDAIETDGFTIGITQAVSEQFKIGAAYGLREIDSGAATDTESLETIHASAFYSPVSDVTFGLEYFTGERTLFDNSTAEADRIQASVQFTF
ncbi:DcaP family trimeric outer membrane transporter [Yoonia sp. BS5-3]|uniref:DcaP family trimeric outer membrane transporter n=1 Tax=Yoonia phaeophyticola TaxID=3137369 RepID=A0ABZ2V9E7_9RHOB